MKKLMLVLGLLQAGYSMTADETWLQRVRNQARESVRCLDKSIDVHVRDWKFALSVVVFLFSGLVRLQSHLDSVHNNPELLKDNEFKQFYTKINSALVFSFYAYNLYKIAKIYRSMRPHYSQSNGAVAVVDEIHYPESTLTYNRRMVPLLPDSGYVNVDMQRLAESECLVCREPLHDVTAQDQEIDRIGCATSCCKNIVFCSVEELKNYIEKNVNGSKCPHCRQDLQRIALIDLKTGKLLKHEKGQIQEIMLIEGNDLY